MSIVPGTVETVSGLIERARRQPSAILLAVQLLGVLIYPYLGESRTGSSAVSLFGLLVLALAVWSVETTAWTVWVSIVLGVPAVVLTLCRIASEASVWQAWGSGFEAALSFTTLSSTGLSDVVPVLPHARSFVMIEQLAGLAYVAMIVFWMVGLTVARARTRDEVAHARDQGARNEAARAGSDEAL
jgi:hypothetical protein